MTAEPQMLRAAVRGFFLPSEGPTLKKPVLRTTGVPRHSWKGDAGGGGRDWAMRETRRGFLQLQLTAMARLGFLLGRVLACGWAMAWLEGWERWIWPAGMRRGQPSPCLAPGEGALQLVGTSRKREKEKN